MNILVAVKRVIDPYVKIRVRADQSGVDTQNVKMSMNPFDEIAVEEALRLKARVPGTQVTLVTIGPEAAKETLRHGLALGADAALFVRSDLNLEPLNCAKILKKIVQDKGFNLVLMGKQSIDGDNNQTPQMLAALLAWPQATYASEIKEEGTSLQVTRELDGGLETLSLSLPAVVSVDLRLNEPRYATLPNIMNAKRKPLEEIELSSLALILKAHQEVISVQEPKKRRAGVKLANVVALIDKLKNEAKVL